MSDNKWSGKSLGNRYGYLFFIYLIKWFPRSLTYGFLILVSYFYYLFAAKQKQALKVFYTKVFPDLSKIEINDLIKQNFFHLAQSIVDRVSFLSKDNPKFDFEFGNHQLILDSLAEGKGLVLLGSHLGNWEIAGEMLFEKGIKQKVNVVLLDNEKEGIKELLEKVKRPNSFNIIAIKEDFSHVIQMKNVIDRGEILCVLADRFMENSRTIDLDFMGFQMEIPLGIFMFIEKFKVPILFFYNIKTGRNEYLLTAIESSNELNGRELANEYVDVLANMVKKYPEQFFNYHFFLNTK